MTDNNKNANGAGSGDGAYTKTSKFLCKVLRHQPELIGIHPDIHGWVSVDELLTRVGTKHPLTMEILERIVAEDEKTRYSFSEDKKLIRCNYGHSYTVEPDCVETEPPAVLYHGTASRFRARIEAEGIKPMSRQFVHLSADTATAEKVGRRHGEPVIFGVMAREMYADGYKFFAAVDKIWLTGSVPPEYLIAPEQLGDIIAGE